MKVAAPLLSMGLVFAGTLLQAEQIAVDEARVAAVEEVDGRWFNAEGIPTFKIEDDGTLDWSTFSGFRRYHAECHVCHGPDGEGSTYAPALKDSVLQLDYYEFLTAVNAGIQKVGASETSVMPAFGTNRNVTCYLDDIYAYLLARGTGAVERGRPAKRGDKSPEYAEIEKSCMEG